MTICSAFDRPLVPQPGSQSNHSNRSLDNRGRAAAISLLGTLVLLVLFSSSAFAQYGEPTKLKIKSAVLGEDRVILVRTPAGYATNKNAYPVLYMTDGDAHIGHTGSTIEFLARKKTEGKTHREAVRSLKRHLARRIWQLLRAPH